MIRTFLKKYTAQILVAIAVIIEILFLLFVITQGDQKSISTYMLINSAVFILFIAAYLVVKKNNDTSSRITVLQIIIIAGILFRITMLPTSPSTSDDVYRYIWEGKIIVNGHNPFEVSPNNASLNYLHSENLPKLVTFKNMTAIYPPLAQLVFAASYLIAGEEFFGLKIIYLLAELITILFIVKILNYRQQNPALVIMYAWLPLPIMEYFINNHIDAVGIMFFIIFVYYTLKDKYIAASIPFALSVLTKFYPLMFVPLLLKKFGLKKTIVFLAVATSVVIIFFIPFIPTEHVPNESLSTYLRKWSFNGSLFKIGYLITNSGYDSRSFMLALFVVSVGNIAIKYKDFLKGVYGVWICFIMFSATLYPWYLGWIAAVNPMIVYASVTSLLFTSNISNLSPLAEKWTEYWWALLLQYIPFYLLLIKEAYPMFRNRYFRD